MKKISLIIGSMFLLVQLGIAQCSTHKRTNHKKYSNHHYQNDLIDVAVSNDNFSTLVTAVKAADLVDALKSEGPFTIFAPSNIAFSRLPDGTVDELLDPRSKKELSAILTYHVINSKITAESLVSAIQASGGDFSIKTLNGTTLTAKIIDNNPVLIDEQGNKSFITQTDIDASNGIIHVIDRVVLP